MIASVRCSVGYGVKLAVVGTGQRLSLEEERTPRLGSTRRETEASTGSGSSSEDLLGQPGRAQHEAALCAVLDSILGHRTILPACDHPFAPNTTCP